MNNKFIFVARCNSDDNGGCEHLCTIVNDEVKCDCFAGFQLAENGINCVGELNTQKSFTTNLLKSLFFLMV